MTEISSSELNDSYDDCILYELLVYSEWKQDPELLVSKVKFYGFLKCSYLLF